ncbi:hypothetical protein CYFUS_005793 [Cystobacter fuscus]|uniref:Uncharacterized protein n=1 Tax=Cystobacter fuscus TaxID=43 RepID=A0A250J8W5_9BACT|nr:hypothetical protein [Cystobacter fuscus]ATB40344.1 hypothetical protein CYFUS_005793 [Cystobacter fuscus]
MRAPTQQSPRHRAMALEKMPISAEVERLFGARPSSDRPGSLREAIVRWLNEEL